MLTLEFLKNYLEEYHLPYEEKTVLIQVKRLKFQFEIPHRSKYFSNQKEQLKLFRVMMEQ